MQIEEQTLTEEDVGRRVRYVPMHADGDVTHEDCEDGKISGWNDKFVFVRYHQGDTSAATLPEDLRWR